MNCLRVGEVLYHKTNNTKCTVKQITHNTITIELEFEIAGKKQLILPINHLGDWLFYKIEDMSLDISQLAEKSEYQEGKKINEYLEVKRKIELEQERQMQIQLEKEKEIQRQNKLMKDQSIESVLRTRNIENLIHFTRVENLEGILKNGFVARNILEKYNAKYFSNDEQRLDYRKDCTCFSVEFPNNFLFRKFRDKYPEAKWAVIEVDSDILIHHIGEKFFCYQNAARSDIRWKIRCGELGTAYDFERMFSEEDNYNRINGSGVRCRSLIKGIKKFLPTSEQAEILLSGNISSDFIKRIYFNNEVDYKYFLNSITNRELISRFNYEINHTYFLDREKVTFLERRKTIG